MCDSRWPNSMTEFCVYYDDLYKCSIDWQVKVWCYGQRYVEINELTHRADISQEGNDVIFDQLPVI